MSVFEDIPIRRASTASQVSQGLTDLIVRGELAPGSTLRENAVATSLGISRNTVREAVRLLERSGLVRHELNRGTVVIEPSIEELNNLYEARVALEVAAVREKATPERLAGLESAMRDLEESAARGAMPDLVKKDLAFHAAVVALLGSSRVDAFYRQLILELEFYLMVLSVEEREFERPDFVISEHRAILDVIKADDPVRAASVVKAHIDFNTEVLREILRRRSAS